MRADRWYVAWALGYAVVGMALGLEMGATHNHSQFVTHAHVLLVGFVTSPLYAVIHRLWLPGIPTSLVTSQFLTHQLGSMTMLVGLSILCGAPGGDHRAEPWAAGGVDRRRGGCRPNVDSCNPAMAIDSRTAD